MTTGKLSLPGSGVQLELFMRSSAPAAARERQTAAVERLRALGDDDGIEAVAVRTWEKRIPVGEHAREEGATHHAYAAFEDWARGRGVELRPFFDTHECYSSITGESYTALVLPVLCLAVSESDRLSAVFPHATPERTYAVGDALDALATDESSQSQPTRVSAGAY
jgi:hypothetical protein